MKTPAYALLVTGSILDVYTTITGIEQGYLQEINPYSLKVLEHWGYLGMAAAKLIGVMALVTWSQYVHHRFHEYHRIPLTAMSLIGAFWILIAGHNHALGAT